jgi:hypothetical protein
MHRDTHTNTHTHIYICRYIYSIEREREREKEKERQRADTSATYISFKILERGRGFSKSSPLWSAKLQCLLNQKRN